MKLHLYMNLNFSEKVHVREWTEGGKTISQTERMISEVRQIRL